MILVLFASGKKSQGDKTREIFIQVTLIKATSEGKELTADAVRTRSREREQPLSLVHDDLIKV